MRRSLPAQPSLRFIKIEAKRRLAAGEFPALHAAQAAVAREYGFATWAALKDEIEHPALAQLSWIVGRFRDADTPSFRPPSDDEMRAHFGEQMLAAIPATELVRQIAGVAAQLRAGMTVIDADDHYARVLLGGLEIIVGVEDDPPHRIIGLNSTVPDSRIADPRVASPPTQISGDAPADAQALAVEHGSPGIVLAGGPPTWVVAHGRADLEGDRPVDPGDRLPAYGITALVTATAVLRLVADGRVDLDQPANTYLQTVRLADGGVTVRQLLGHSGGVNSPAIADMFTDRIPDLAALLGGPVVGCDGARGVAQPSNGGYAVLGQLLSDLTGQRYVEAATHLVLEPLEMRNSSFPTAPDPDGFIGYALSPDGMFTPVRPGICAIPAAGGLWADASDLMRLGTGWSTLLPPALVDEALTAQTLDGPDGFTIGLGWLLDPGTGMAMHAGTGPGGSAALALRTTDRSVRLVVVNRAMPLSPIIDRLIGMRVQP